MNSELKTLKRKRMREYRERGKTDKYDKLKNEFKLKFKKAAENFLRKNVDTLKQANPGQAYNVLKKMGAQPGEYEESSNFTLPSHENLTPLEAADKIAEFFSKISREFPPLNMETLPSRVTEKLKNPKSESEPPCVMEYEVYERIKKANKPKAGVPGDLPRKLVNEFGPELADPVCKIFNNIVQSSRQGVAKWPTAWKQEFGTPLQKIPDPTTENDLRIISLTPFFSKVMEKFVVEWLMGFIGSKLDPKQFGGLKGNSISHYMIELIHFILYNQDYNLPIGVLLCAIDFSKAFNRLNHNLLITKLSDMGVPGWLLNIVMGFLSDRVMVVRFKGETTETKPLPGGPQGTLLGLLLFLILINDCGVGRHELNIGKTITNQKKKFQPATTHMKYVDDFTIAESMNLKDNLDDNSDKPLPDMFHAQTGHKLDNNKSLVYEELMEIQEYSVNNQMKLNLAKTKLMLFNPTLSFDFVPDFTVEDTEIETVEDMKLLGLILRNDLSWKSNTENIIKKAYARIWILKRLKNRGGNLEDLTDIFIKQVRSVLEFGVPVWNSSLTKEESNDIERIQKCFLHIALGNSYNNYEEALETANLDSLESRRTQLCTTFAIRAAKHSKHKHWFSVNKEPVNTRSEKLSYKPPLCRLTRYQDSPIPYLTGLLNNL